jgi:hypothetical protein
MEDGMHGRNLRFGLLTLLAVAFVALLLAPPAQAQLTFASADGKASFKLGGLVQFQGEDIDNAASTGQAENLYFRRLRLIGLFKYGDNVQFFFETDSPNLGKQTPPATTKDTGNVFIQDAIATWTQSKAFNLDVGMMLPPLSYNHGQSAATLMAIDYGPYTFIESTPLQQRTGRDYGVQARGYVVDDKLEYRFGLFQGVRGDGASNSLRTFGRVMWYALGPAQVGYFYRGTSLGKTQSLSFGASYDHQEDYDEWAGDVYWDQPVGGNGDGLTFQGDYSEWDGGKTIALPKQKTVLTELGFYFAPVRLLPYVQYSKRHFDAVNGNDESKVQIGAGYYFNGHNANVKAAWGRIDPTVGKTLDQILVQMQLYLF